MKQDRALHRKVWVCVLFSNTFRKRRKHHTTQIVIQFSLRATISKNAEIAVLSCSLVKYIARQHSNTTHQVSNSPNFTSVSDVRQQNAFRCTKKHSLTRTSHERLIVSNHWALLRLFNGLCSLTSKETSKLHITALCEDNPLGTDGFPSPRDSNAESASMSWRHHRQKHSAVKLSYQRNQRLLRFEDQ